MRCCSGTLLNTGKSGTGKNTNNTASKNTVSESSKQPNASVRQNDI